ncbi:glycoside hydrolase family 97 C-terminal domain-containing protein [Planctomycetes bacterium TBK1r]|uniref:glycoside hydrolase family 97 C-terminal domain-containing protein n=1 Tax=Stieleria magnilauensis TaxID=2527963 RepID=UPI00119D36EB
MVIRSTIVNEARSVEIPLDFLGPAEFTAKIYAEDPQDKKLVTIETRPVTSDSSLTAMMSSGSGCAIMITPQSTSTE